MTWLEKWFVNRSQKAKGNIARVRQRLAELPSEAIEDVLEIGCGTGTVAAFLAETYKMNVRAFLSASHGFTAVRFIFLKTL